MPKKLVLAVIDGLTPVMLERALAEGRLPALSFLREAGTYARATTTFPSVTPVCLTSIATGAHPDVHSIPHLVWYHRGERRVVEYGSSFSAVRAAGARRSIRDSVFAMSHEHVSPRVLTVFEALEDAGVVPAAINFTCYRGRTRHPLRLRLRSGRNRWYEAVYGPRRFFFFNLFESDVTGAPLAIRSRPEGSVDAYAASIGRWLVTRDGFDFLVFYLPDYDYASHLFGPDSAVSALERADAAVGELMAAAGGQEAFLERYAIVVCSDHGQTHVDRVACLQDSYADLRVFTGRRGTDPADCDVVVTGSNRSGMVYALDGRPPRELAERLDGAPGVDLALFAENGDAVVRKGGAELRFALDGEGDREVAGEEGILGADEYPNAFERISGALRCPNAGDVIVSAAEGWEFEDLGGRHHAGGGSHGSLIAGDSTVPMLAAGFDEPPLPPDASVTDLAPLALAHFGVQPPPSMRARVAAGA
ncbi:MAG TPA: alkaline phosphatase family protein [Gaiellaceae bacterium]|nr:alkaline phosphatase family protein [Gaiellaceae bacterium]